MNPVTLNITPRWRTILYIATGALSPVVAYLNAKGIIGALEVGVWSAEVLFISALAAFNVDRSKP